MADFILDSRLAADTLPVLDTPHLSLRLMNDSRWRWLILVPRVVGATELHDLSGPQQALLWHDALKAGRILKGLTGCGKINTAAIGNIVRQLHVHVIARSEGDTNWPNPVWGHPGRTPYDDAEALSLAGLLRQAWEETT